MNDFNFTTSVDSLDVSALLITLGYELKECKVVNHVNLNTENHTPRPTSASWHFSKYSRAFPEAGNIEKVLKKYTFPELYEPSVNVYQLAKIAAHNYQVLKTVILKGEKLQQLEGPNYVMLKNNNGKYIGQEALYGGSSDIASIAVAAALGCKVISYGMINGKLNVSMAPSKDGINLHMIEQMKHDPAIANENNFNVLPILVAMFINRDILKKEIYEQTKTIMITRGDRIVMFNKNASDSIKHKALKFINE